MPSEIFIINSADRVSGTTGYATFELPSGLYQKYHKCEILSVSVPTGNNVSSGNNTIQFISSVDGLKTAQITPGIYNISTIAAAVKAAMDAAGTVTYTVTVAGNRLMITPSSGTITMLLSSTNTKQAAVLLGFDPLTNSGPAAFVIGPNLINLGYPQYLIFDLSFLEHKFKSTNQREQGSFGIMVDQNSGAYTLWSESNDFDVMSDLRNLQNITIMVRGPSGEIYNPLDYSIMLRLK